ncbi:MAG: radical SAM protein [Thermodesulfobacteriota bacterium]|nr:radical SAM protein [Thermodesulfobacteriota bacterium]
MDLFKGSEDKTLVREIQKDSFDDEYIFRYRIEDNKSEDDTCNSRLDLIRTHLRNILDVMIPCSGGSEVRIDGLKLMNDRSHVHQLCDQNEKRSDSTSTHHRENNTSKERATNVQADNTKTAEAKNIDQECKFQSLKNATLYEPTIEYIERQLRSLLDLVDLEKSGEIVKVDGFRLKDLSQWVEESPCDPADMLGYIATRCNCNCTFCYNKGCPPSVALDRPAMSPDEEFSEVRTRLRYFSPEKRSNLFPGLGIGFEALIHPHFKDVLNEIRKKTDRLIRISTNGTPLTEEMIDFLRRFHPLHLDIALHSSLPARRVRLMGDKSPEVAIKSLPLLRRAGIVYDIVIVPWHDESLEEMLDDLEQTVFYAGENDVRLVQVSLPGYSKYFSERELFDHDFVWEAVTGKTRELREKCPVPIVIRPAMYEETLLYDQKNMPEIIGTVHNSPAFHSGVQRGDVFTKIGSNIIKNRPQARDLLSILQRSEMESIPMEVLRKNRKLELSLNLNRHSYPYSKEIDTHVGVIFMGTGLRTGYLESLQRIIEQNRNQKILLLTSVLVKSLLEQIINEAPFFGQWCDHIEIGVPPNRFFGGNICMGDLLVVQDFIDYIKDYVTSADRKPDLVVIPSSPFNISGWGRDLTGRVYLDIERETGIPVEIIECQAIYD